MAYASGDGPRMLLAPQGHRKGWIVQKRQNEERCAGCKGGRVLVPSPRVYCCSLSSSYCRGRLRPVSVWIDPLLQKGPSFKRVGRRAHQRLSFGGLPFLTREGGLCSRCSCQKALCNVLCSFGFSAPLVHGGGLLFMVACHEDVHLRAVDLLISCVRYLPMASTIFAWNLPGLRRKDWSFKL